MKKNTICKNAIYIGSIDKTTKVNLIKKQYPIGSTLVSKDDLMPISDIEDDNTHDTMKVINRFPKLSKNLF